MRVRGLERTRWKKAEAERESLVTGSDREDQSGSEGGEQRESEQRQLGGVAQQAPKVCCICGEAAHIVT